MILLSGMALASLALACGTTRVDLRYAREQGAAQAPASASRIAVGEFTDARGTDATRLGSIRSGVGNPMKRLVLEKPASEVVGQAFSDALRERGLLAEPSGEGLELSGRIEKLECNQFSNREAHVVLRVRLVDSRSGQEVFADIFQADLVESGGVGGPFASVEGLRALTERALGEAVDAAVDDDRLRKAL
jgi:hypothetical protein